MQKSDGGVTMIGLSVVGEESVVEQELEAACAIMCSQLLYYSGQNQHRLDVKEKTGNGRIVDRDEKCR